jgi:dodecin
MIPKDRGGGGTLHFFKNECDRSLLRFRGEAYNPEGIHPSGAILMTQKVIEIVGTSNQSFAKAAESAVKEAAKTVREIKWAHVESLDMLLDGAKVVQYRATTKIYFDVEH